MATKTRGLFTSTRLSRHDDVQDSVLQDIIQIIRDAMNEPGHSHIATRWSPMPSDASTSLRKEVEDLYWHGARAEVQHVLDTLFWWESPKLKDKLIPTDDERDTFVHGFDTFIDQVSLDGRRFATQAARCRYETSGPEHTGFYRVALERTAQDTRRQIRAERIKCDVREQAEARLTHARDSDTLSRSRTRMFMRAIGLLDIDKILEHEIGGKYNEPTQDLSKREKADQPQRSAVPQLEVRSINKKTGLPVVAPVLCSACNDAIRGSSYEYLQQDHPLPPGAHNKDDMQRSKLSRRFTICETCRSVLPVKLQSRFSKTYKHSIITSELTTAKHSHQLCKCPVRTSSTAEHMDQNFNKFPMHKSAKHSGVLDTGPDHRMQIFNGESVLGPTTCGLMKLPMVVARASKQAMEVAPQASSWRSSAMVSTTRRFVGSLTRDKLPGISSKKGESKVPSHSGVATRTTGCEAYGDKAPNSDKDSGGGIDGPKHGLAAKVDSQWDEERLGGHKSLRLGPLMFETGIPENGSPRILISLRDDLHCGPNRPKVGTGTEPTDRGLALGLTDRIDSDFEGEKTTTKIRLYRSTSEVWRDRHDSETNVRRRIACVEKQVVGSPFSCTDNAAETAILDDLVILAQRLSCPPEGQTVSDCDVKALEPQDSTEVQASLDLLMDRLKHVLSPRLDKYLDEIIPQLLNMPSHLLPPTTMSQTRSKHASDSWAFCDFIMRSPVWHRLAGPELQTHPASSLKEDSKHSANHCGELLYTISFVCHPNRGRGRSTKIRAQQTELPRTKYDARRGFTQDYLLSPSQSGQRHSSDMFDSLQEFWHDWAGFRQNLYCYQDLFPWDCTEAYGRNLITCGTSTGRLPACNLAKHLWAFPYDSWSLISLHLTRARTDYPGKSSAQLNDAEWAQNRLLLACALEELTVAAGCMAEHPLFRVATAWLATPVPTSDDTTSDTKTLDIDDETDTDDDDEVHLDHDDHVKLGGIHRAQPFGYAMLHSPPSKPVLAPWVHLRHADKVSEYEDLRRAKMRAFDVGFGADNGGSSERAVPPHHGQRSRLGYTTGRDEDSVTPSGGSSSTSDSAGNMLTPDGGYSAAYLMATRRVLDGGQQGCSQGYQDLPAIYTSLLVDGHTAGKGRKGGAASTRSSSPWSGIHGSGLSGNAGSTRAGAGGSSPWFYDFSGILYQVDAGIGVGGEDAHGTSHGHGGGGGGGGGYSEGGGSSGGGDSGGGGSSGGGGDSGGGGGGGYGGF
ncbi:uncharacterized protein B0I36DRAFT_382737 [Microdochium trichocladiopsis]|uniref:Uncharacterized protein n=1 Tax=Microdochium trichocladiopsis TaxID=1682393 RepID=A0A9P8Y829_9PEZI|nr:uncharacterized protein B0I36DRAFT_382737 [Microdochium trichocladiopsis]KAH7032718.1 hypothetical protein B0I36DRAFT_382737 [Microdochium trichocladiopsis]